MFENNVRHIPSHVIHSSQHRAETEWHALFGANIDSRGDAHSFFNEGGSFTLLMDDLRHVEYELGVDDDGGRFSVIARKHYGATLLYPVPDMDAKDVMHDVANKYGWQLQMVGDDIIITARDVVYRLRKVLVESWDNKDGSRAMVFDYLVEIRSRNPRSRLCRMCCCM